MRPLARVLTAVSLLALAGPAQAKGARKQTNDPCGAACANYEETCHKECEEQQKPPTQACLAECKEGVQKCKGACPGMLKRLQNQEKSPEQLRDEAWLRQNATRTPAPINPTPNPPDPAEANSKGK